MEIINNNINIKKMIIYQIKDINLKIQEEDYILNSKIATTFHHYKKINSKNIYILIYQYKILLSKSKLNNKYQINHL